MLSIFTVIIAGFAFAGNDYRKPLNRYFRVIDVVSPPTSDLKQDKDYYINGGEKDDLHPGSILKVYRRQDVFDRQTGKPQESMYVPIADVRVIKVTQTNCVARLESKMDPNALPVIEYTNIMVGDFVQLYIQAPEYVPTETPTPIPLEMLITPTPTSGPEYITLPSHVLFGPQEVELRKGAEIYLDEIAQKIIKGSHRVRVEGHTDNTGSIGSNYVLSRKRAVAVAKYLESKGVQKDRIAVKFFGETKPLATNDTAEGRAANRRVEIILE